MSLVSPVALNDRISPDYLAQQRAFHTARQDYGTSSPRYVDDIRSLIEKLNCTSVLDYGCGKGLLRQALGDIVREYDPAIPGKDAEPEPADLVVCTDVLEDDVCYSRSPL